MTTTLLHSGKIEHFRALGETGQPVYHSALQLRKVISRRLPGQERHLAIPQRDQQGESVDWYSGIAGDVVPWSSATEDEREDARIQLEAFRQEVIKLNQAPPEGQGGDHEVFTRLVKWVSHFPDDNFVYLVDGTPVLVFWGFIHPEADRHANPLLCLYPSTTSQKVQSTPPTVAPVSSEAIPEPVQPQAIPVTPVRPWWRRWWWLLPLLLALALLLFGLRACSSPSSPTLSTPSLGTNIPNASFPQSLWQGWNIWPFNRGSGGSLSAPNLTAPNLNFPNQDSGSLLPDTGGDIPTVNAPESPSGLSAPDPLVPDTDLQAQPALGTAPEADLPNPDDIPAPPTLPDGVVPPVLALEDSTALPSNASPSASGMSPPTLEPLSLPSDTPDGAATFLNGNWRGAGVMDSQTGHPLQVSYAFDQGQGQMYIQRGGSNSMTCAGPVSAVMQNGELQVQAQEQARCEDGSHYEMPRVQCHQADAEAASCAASYDDEPFPMQLRKNS